MNHHKENILQKTIMVWFGALICCALWGSAFPCIKIGYKLFAIQTDAVSSQILFAGYRFTLAGIITIAMGSLLNKKLLVPKKESFIKIFNLSMLQTVTQYLFFYIGLAHTSGVKASIIEGTSVFIALLVASLLFKQEKLSFSKIIGCLLGFAGVILINLTGNGFDLNISFLGEGFILLSTTSYAFSSVFIKKYSQVENPVILSGYQFILGGIIMCLYGILTGGNVTGFTLNSSLMLLYLAFVSAVAYTLWGKLLQYNPVSKVAVFGFMTPVFGVLLSAFLLHENSQAFGPNSIIALVLVSVGVYIVNKVNR